MAGGVICEADWEDSNWWDQERVKIYRFISRGYWGDIASPFHNIIDKVGRLVLQYVDEMLFLDIFAQKRQSKPLFP